MSDIVTSKNTFSEPICNNCKHWNKGTLSCKAFSRIPKEILSGYNDHSKPLLSQDNDFVFEALTATEKRERQKA
jgi:hypothetical protein